MKGEQLRLLIVVLLLFAGFTLQPLPCGAVSETDADLDERQRMRIFDKVWQTIQNWYYDPAFGGVDWKAVGKDFRQRAAVAPGGEAFHALIAEMLTNLPKGDGFKVPASLRMSWRRLRLRVSGRAATRSWRPLKSSSARVIQIE